MAQQYTNKRIDENTGIASVTLDGMQFTNIDLSEGSKTTADFKIAPKDSVFDPSSDLQNNTALIIKAVDIDWNGAKPGIGENRTTGITTTGELLSRIKEVYSPMFAN